VCAVAVTEAGHGYGYGAGVGRGGGLPGGVGGSSAGGGCGYYRGCVQKLANYERYIAAGLITFTDRELEHGCM